MIQLDGNYLEGGGQIVRTALGLSVLAEAGFSISDVRKGRKQPGLKNQHLSGIQGIQQICGAIVEGAELGSDHLRFVPKHLQAKNITIDIGTAGSITLLFQSLLIPCLFADKKMTVTVKGGTDTKWAQPYDYFAHVLVPQLQRFCLVEPRLIRRGYYPRGGGEVSVTFTPKFRRKDSTTIQRFQDLLSEEVLSFQLTERGSVLQIKGVSHASAHLQDAQVAERQARAAELLLKKVGCPIDIRTEYSNTPSVGSGITLWAICSQSLDEIDQLKPIRIGADALGEKGILAEKVGQQAAEQLLAELDHGAPVDRFLADQLIPFMGLVGKSSIRTTEITPHCKTNVYVVEQFLQKLFTLKGDTIQVS